MKQHTPKLKNLDKLNILDKGQCLNVKGGDDKRPPRPGDSGGGGSTPNSPCQALNDLLAQFG